MGNEVQGKVCVVTGAASGMGLVMCQELARRGAVVVAVARDEARAAAAEAAVRRAVDGARVEGLACDVSSIASIKRAAAELVRRHPKIHVLVNNAAVFGKERRTTVDGLELGYAVNTLAPYLLSTLLLDALKAGAPSRIVSMTMGTKTAMAFDDLQSARKFAALKTFQMTKGGMQYLTKQLAKKLEGSGVDVMCVNPGLTQSKLPSEAPLPLRIVFKLFGKTPAKGAARPLSLCLDDKWKNGAYVDDKGRATEFPPFMDDGACERLWNENAKLAR